MRNLLGNYLRWLYVALGLFLVQTLTATGRRIERTRFSFVAILFLALVFI